MLRRLEFSSELLPSTFFLARVGLDVRDFFGVVFTL